MNAFVLPEGFSLDERRADFSLPPTFEPGDIVSLLVGGPDLVVLSYCDECGDVAVAWIDSDGDVQTEVFPEEVLIDV